jgi:hypothetical protein
MFMEVGQEFRAPLFIFFPGRGVQGDPILLVMEKNTGVL